MDGVRYQMIRLYPGVSCARIKRVVLPFLRDGTVKPGWFCFRGHRSQSQSWAAKCSHANHVVVRVDAPTLTAASETDCGLTRRIKGAGYQVFISRGSYPCAPTKRVVYRYLLNGRVDAPWACHHTQGSAARNYFVACSRGASVRVHVVAPT